MSLEEVLQFIEAKEAGKRFAGHLSQSHGVDAARSQYRRAKNDEVKQRKDGDINELCSYCNKRGHGKSAPTSIRRHDCPAYGTICDKCGRQNHFASVCRSKGTRSRTQQPTPTASKTEKQKVQFLTHFAPQPASVGQAKESSHLTITSTATSLTTGFDSHPSLNHSLRSQHQPILKTIQPWDTTPPNHG